MNSAASPSCTATCTSSAVPHAPDAPAGPPTPPTGASSTRPHSTAPATTAAASHSQRRIRARRIGRPGHRYQIEHHRPRARLVGAHQQRHHQGAGEAQPGQRRPVQRRGQHGGDGDGSQRHKRRRRPDEPIERVCGIGHGERDCRARGRQDAGDMRRRQRRHRRGPLAAPEPLAAGNERRREHRAEPHPDGRAEHLLLDGIAHQQHPAEGQRQPSDPHRPARPQPLLQAGRGHGRSRRLRRQLRPNGLHGRHRLHGYFRPFGWCCRRLSGSSLIGSRCLRLPGRWRGRRLASRRARDGNLRPQRAHLVRQPRQSRLQPRNPAPLAGRQHHGDRRQNQCQPVHTPRPSSARRPSCRRRSPDTLRRHRRAPAGTLSQYTLTAQQHTRTSTRSPRTVAVLHPCPDVCTPFAGNSVAFLRRLGYFCGGTGGVCRMWAWKSLTPSAGGT